MKANNSDWFSSFQMTMVRRRNEFELTQKELASLCLLNESTIKQYEYGTRGVRPSFEPMRRIMKVLGFSDAEILDLVRK